jgi:hypothetical protein
MDRAQRSTCVTKNQVASALYFHVKWWRAGLPIDRPLDPDNRVRPSPKAFPELKRLAQLGCMGKGEGRAASCG